MKKTTNKLKFNEYRVHRNIDIISQISYKYLAETCHDLIEKYLKIKNMTLTHDSLLQLLCVDGYQSILDKTQLVNEDTLITKEDARYIAILTEHVLCEINRYEEYISWELILDKYKNYVMEELHKKGKENETL